MGKLSETAMLLKADHEATLFPLRANTVLVEIDETAIRDYLQSAVFSKEQEKPQFGPYPRAQALKRPLQARSVLLLDPIGTYYLYDFVNRNRSSFKKVSLAGREAFGYYFKDGSTLSPVEERKRFREIRAQLRQKYKFYGKIDVANCFNSFYQHDIVEFLTKQINLDEAAQFGQFLRQGNAGRSISCFPQGYLPAKVIGNGFLGFIEQSRRYRSAAIIRYMDDVYFFSNNKGQIEQDLYVVQEVLAVRSLSINAEKTEIGSSAEMFGPHSIDEIRKSLLQKREVAVTDEYGFEYVDEDGNPITEFEEIHLTSEESEYLTDLISAPDASEEDVELALSLLTDDQQYAGQIAEAVFTKYPHLIRNLYRYLTDAAYDGPMLFEMMAKRVKNPAIHGFELFWIAKSLLDYWQFSDDVAQLLIQIYEHRSADDAVRGVILETKENRHGFDDMKEEVLRNVGSHVTLLSAAVGLLSVSKARRNQLYQYAANLSPNMRLLCGILRKSS